MFMLPIFGFAFLAIALVFYLKLWKIKRNDIETEGEIVDVLRRKNSRSTFPIVKFQTVGNTWITRAPDFFSLGKAPQRGEKVKVIYNPHNPNDFVVRGKSGTIVPYLILGIFFLSIWGILLWQEIEL
jgi:hypothetical protein